MAPDSEKELPAVISESTSGERLEITRRWIRRPGIGIHLSGYLVTVVWEDSVTSSLYGAILEYLYDAGLKNPSEFISSRLRKVAMTSTTLLFRPPYSMWNEHMT